MLGQHLACYEGSNDPQRKIFPFAALRFYAESSSAYPDFLTDLHIEVFRMLSWLIFFDISEKEMVV